MTKEKIMSDLQEIFQELTDNPAVILKPETAASDVEEWDSILHIQLMVAIEEHFNIVFTADEIGSYDNIGEMCDGIFKKNT